MDEQLSLKDIAQQLAEKQGDKGVILLAYNDKDDFYRFGQYGLTHEEIERACCTGIHLNFQNMADEAGGNQ